MHIAVLRLTHSNCMTSQITSRVEYLIPSDNIIVFDYTSILMRFIDDSVFICRPGFGSPTTKSVGYMVRRVHRYKLIQIGRLGLAVPVQTVLARPVIYGKTPVQSGANLTVYIRTISVRVDLTRIFLHIFTICARNGPAFFCRDYPPARRGSAIPPNIGI